MSTNANDNPNRVTATEERTVGGRVLWEGRPDPDVARRLARPWVGFGWIVVALAAYLFASGLVFQKEKGRTPVFSASLEEASHRIVAVRVDGSELRRRAALVAGQVAAEMGGIAGTDALGFRLVLPFQDGVVQFRLP